MAWLPRALMLAAASAAVVAAPPWRHACAQDGGGEEPAAAPKPADLYEQVDRKHTMSIKLPRSWKSLSGDEAVADALASFGGFFGEENKSPNGIVAFYTASQFQRASLARALILPQTGVVKPDSLRQQTGWAEGCASEGSNAVWRRFVEKNGRVYTFVVVSHVQAYETVRPTVQRLLDTASVPGEYAAPPLGDAFAAKKLGDFDVVTDAEAGRDAVLKRACVMLGTARDLVAKALPGKPFDAARPAAWIFQNGSKFDDRAKAAGYPEPKYGVFNAVDRCSMVSILGDNAQGYDEALYGAGAQQYVWQYFGGEVPLWVTIGMREYGRAFALGGGKKLVPEMVTKTKGAIAAGKRRLDQWFDVVSGAEIKDDAQGALELFGWHAYFRIGRGAKKYRKQYDAYLQSLRDTGDPAAARKAFDGANFDEMLQDFKSWGNDWKP